MTAMLASILAPDTGNAQLRTVDQTVFGMDCAPCAYALEKRIKRMDGVRAVRVSLDNGLARIEFEPEHPTTLKALRAAVAESGFSAQDAEVRVRGTLQKDSDRWTLTAEDERFVLRDPPAGAESGSVVTLAGRVPKDKIPDIEVWTLDVNEVLR